MTRLSYASLAEAMDRVQHDLNMEAYVIAWMVAHDLKPTQERIDAFLAYSEQRATLVQLSILHGHLHMGERPLLGVA